MDEDDRELETIESTPDSPPWDRNVKLLVGVITLIVIVAVAARFTDLILRIVAAGIIAYVLTPLINWIAEYTPLKRGSAIIATYLLLVILFIGSGVVLGVNTFRQVNNLIVSIPDLLEGIVEWFETTDVLTFGPFSLEVASVWGTIDWQAIEERLIATILPIVNQSGRTVVVILSSTVDVITVVLFTFIVSIYLAFEMGRLGGYISRSVHQPGYRRDTERILIEFNRIWEAYLRGQIILAFVIFLAVWISLTILGVQNAFALGILSGLLEFLPVIGPFIGTVAAATVAFFQPTNYLGFDPVVYTLIVIGVMIVIQQIENNILVPRIVGGALDLHPLVVIIGVFMGATLTGLIGAILAAPVLATIKLLGTYAWRKMFDLSPFPEPVQKEQPERISIYRRILSLLNRAKKPSTEES
ncbi:MAG: AI-2E family transporter [Chloroflexota bacterium]|jgi:predicted PurR-regulated permease PerM